MINNVIPETDRSNDDGVLLLLAGVRLEARRRGAEMMCDRLEKLARHIIRRQLNSAEAAQLLREEAENLHNQAQELH